jgi:hypothetical protein
MRTSPSSREKQDLRESFNDFLEKVFRDAKKISEEGKTSSLTLAELARLALERREKAEKAETEKARVVRTEVRPVGTNQMEKWVRESLAALKKEISPSEEAIVSAMALYNIFENARTPKDLDFNKWIVG